MFDATCPVPRTRPEQLVYIGLGSVEAIAAIKALPGVPTTLIIPDEVHASALRSEADPGWEIVIAMLGETENPITLHHYNFPLLDSPLPATDTLHKRFPGLRRTHSSSLPPTPPGKILKDLSKERYITLVVDFPGIAFQILNMLDREMLLESFDVLITPINMNTFYDGEADPTKFVKWCKNRGFELQTETSADPLQAWYVFERPAQSQKSCLQSELEEAQKQIARLTADRDLFQARLNACQKELLKLEGQVEMFQKLFLSGPS